MPDAQPYETQSWTRCRESDDTCRGSDMAPVAEKRLGRSSTMASEMSLTATMHESSRSRAKREGVTGMLEP